MERVVVLDRGRHAFLIINGEECFRAFYAPVRKLPTPVLPRLESQACRPRIDLTLIDIPPALVRFAPVKAGGLNSRDAIRQSHRDHILCDVGGVLLMVAERSHRILRGRGAVRVRHRAQGRVPDRSKIERKKAFASQLQVVKRGYLHNEIMWMLSVGDWLSERCFSLLEEYRITAFCHGL